MLCVLSVLRLRSRRCLSGVDAFVVYVITGAAGALYHALLGHGASDTSHLSVRRFPEVALAWAGGLMRGFDAEMHGVDLYGRDSLLLGRLLTTLARPFSLYATLVLRSAMVI